MTPQFFQGYLVLRNYGVFHRFSQDPVRLGNREETPQQKPYRAWGYKIGRKTEN